MHSKIFKEISFGNTAFKLIFDNLVHFIFGDDTHGEISFFKPRT